jgi:hypothetical protein
MEPTRIRDALRAFDFSASSIEAGVHAGCHDAEADLKESLREELPEGCLRSPA